MLDDFHEIESRALEFADFLREHLPHIDSDYTEVIENINLTLREVDDLLLSVQDGEAAEVDRLLEERREGGTST
jgi:hypothetical protein